MDYKDAQEQILVRKIFAAMDQGLSEIEAARIAGVSPGTARRLINANAMQGLVGDYLAKLEQQGLEAEQEIKILHTKMRMAANAAVDSLFMILNDPKTKDELRVKVAQDFLDRYGETQKGSKLAATVQKFSLSKSEFDLAIQTSKEAGLPIIDIQLEQPEKEIESGNGDD